VGRAFVGDVELAGGMGVRTGSSPFAGAEFDDPATFGVMEFLFARAGVAARFSVAAGAQEGDAEGNETVAKAGGFAGGKDEANIGKHDAKSANELDQVAVGHVSERLKFAGAGTKPRKGNGELSFPAVAQQVISMRGDAERFETPIAEAVKGADAETSETGVVRAFGSFETPIEIALWSCGVHIGVDRAIVGFLIDDEPFGASLDDRAIFVGLHGPNFEGDARDFVVETTHAIGHVVGGDEFRMFARNEKDIAEALSQKFAGFFKDFVDGKCYA